MKTFWWLVLLTWIVLVLAAPNRESGWYASTIFLCVVALAATVMKLTEDD